MSIAAAMSSALSGLTVAARSAELVSSNIANALTEGYGRRELEIGARVVGTTGQGVQVNGVTRMADTLLIGDRRIAEAGAADRDLRAAFLIRLETALGSPESAGSLTGRIASLDSALIAAASRPESEARLETVADAARNLIATFDNIADDIQSARTSADARIATEVADVNRTLGQIAGLNSQIVALTAGGRESSGLQDQRQQLIDRIASVIPLREVAQEHGKVALYSTGGAILLDGRPAELGFSQVGMITPDMTLASNVLSGLTLNGRAVRLDAGGPLAGGSLAASFALRDELAPAAQTRLDAVARDLVERFSDPALDPTRAPGAAGLFTDAGADFLPVNEPGISQRLRLNSAVDPAQGGAVWRLRDGLGAAAPGPLGESSLLTSLQNAMNKPREPASGGFAPGARSLSAIAGQMASGVASARLSAETEASFATARSSAMKILELQTSVDTDRELQDLLAIENSYAANAKVVQTVDDMIQILLGI